MWAPVLKYLVLSTPGITTAGEFSLECFHPQPSSQDSAVTTSVVGSVITSLYGEQPQASQTEEVVEETVVCISTHSHQVIIIICVKKWIKPSSSFV